MCGRGVAGLPLGFRWVRSKLCWFSYCDVADSKLNKNKRVQRTLARPKGCRFQWLWIQLMIRFGCRSYRVALPSCLATRASSKRNLARACRYWAWTGSKWPSTVSSDVTDDDVDVGPLRSISEPRSRMDRRSCRFSSRTWRNCSTNWFLQYIKPFRMSSQVKKKIKKK